MDNNLPVWIIASLFKYFSTLGLGLYLEGQPRTVTLNTNIWVELRHDIKLLQRQLNEFDIKVEVNLLVEITDMKGDQYLPQRTVGTLIQACMNVPIPIYDLPSTDLKCCLLLEKMPDPVRSYNIGQQIIGNKTQQIIVEAFYQGQLGS